MQLTLFKDLPISTISPLKTQLLKWVGNKQRFASEIVSYFPFSFNKYLEPFLGSGAVLATLSPNNAIGSDIFRPLMEIWMTLSSSPDTLVQWYKERWDYMMSTDKVEAYEKIKSSYNSCPNGADLLFLARSCYGGVVRFRRNDGCMSTPCGIHNPISPDSFRRRVFEWCQRIKFTKFLILDYKDALNIAKSGDMIYCDPPYLHSQSILYGSQSFKIEDLFLEIDKCKRKGAFIALSIDGKKRSGMYHCEVSIPKGLFKREIFVNCGRSMLKRFQMENRTLENEVVFDRLLLTY
jgi:DNA adenine methylase